MEPKTHKQLKKALNRLSHARSLTHDETLVFAVFNSRAFDGLHVELQDKLDTIVRTYLTAGFDTPRAMAWYLLQISAETAAAYEWRGWTPLHLTELRRAIHDTTHPNEPAYAGPILHKPGEADWIHTNITPDLVPLYVLAGQNPASAREIDRKRRLNGDTTIIPALRTMAALRRTPHL